MSSKAKMTYAVENAETKILLPYRFDSQEEAQAWKDKIDQEYSGLQAPENSPLRVVSWDK